MQCATQQHKESKACSYAYVGFQQQMLCHGSPKQCPSRTCHSLCTVNTSKMLSDSARRVVWSSVAQHKDLPFASALSCFLGCSDLTSRRRSVCQCLLGKGKAPCLVHTTGQTPQAMCFVATLQQIVGPEGQPLLPSKLRYCHRFTIDYMHYELVLGGGVIRC